MWGSLGVLTGFFSAPVASLLRLRAHGEGRVVEAATGAARLPEKEERQRAAMQMAGQVDDRLTDQRAALVSWRFDSTIVLSLGYLIRHRVGPRVSFRGRCARKAAPAGKPS